MELTRNKEDKLQEEQLDVQAESSGCVESTRERSEKNHQQPSELHYGLCSQLPRGMTDSSQLFIGVCLS